MNKTLIQQLKQKLEKEKSDIEASLENFATRDPKLTGDWDTKYPSFDTGHREEEEDEVEEYISRLPVEHSLELRLKDINSALEKIKTRGYGKCEKCAKNIETERLKVYPEARLCAKCEGIKKK